jgi:hypothetical protein
VDCFEFVEVMLKTCAGETERIPCFGGEIEAGNVFFSFSISRRFWLRIENIKASSLGVGLILRLLTQEFGVEIGVVVDAQDVENCIVGRRWLRARVAFKTTRGGNSFRRIFESMRRRIATRE